MKPDAAAASASLARQVAFSNERTKTFKPQSSFWWKTFFPPALLPIGLGESSAETMPWEKAGARRWVFSLNRQRDTNGLFFPSFLKKKKKNCKYLFPWRTCEINRNEMSNSSQHGEPTTNLSFEKVITRVSTKVFWLFYSLLMATKWGEQNSAQVEATMAKLREDDSLLVPRFAKSED